MDQRLCFDSGWTFEYSEQKRIIVEALVAYHC